MRYQVMRVGWGRPSPVGTPFLSKEEAEQERLAWEEQTSKDFREGRIMYDVPTFTVESVE